MMRPCKHCGTRYSQANGPGEFCCAGCEHVYHLIQDAGLDEYYGQQDRVGQPVGNRPFSHLDYVSIKQIQEQAENASGAAMVLGIQGMSCLGCAWLVEQLTRRQSGVLFARAGLETQQLRLKWQPGAFDLGALATDLQKFGYRITSDVGASAGYGVSSLAVRFGLTLIFGLNGLLLTAAAAFGVGDEGLQPLYHLLVLLCLLLGQFIGGALFVRPAWGALQLRRLHSDLLPALCLFVLFAGTLLALLFAGPWLVTAALYFSLLPIMLAARWISQMLERRCMSQNGKQRSE